LDVNLPDVIGYNLCQEMQNRTKVVLMLTSRADEADKIRGFSQGADDYLTKPFSLGSWKSDWSDFEAPAARSLLRQQRLNFAS